MDGWVEVHESIYQMERARVRVKGIKRERGEWWWEKETKGERRGGGSGQMCVSVFEIAQKK